MQVLEPKTSAKAISKEETLRDYYIGYESRQASLMGRKEVFMGKAKFGIFGDGKELPQLAMAKAFQKGDFRSGYYRDQTFMMALGELNVQQFFAQLYAHTDTEADPASSGRQMNGHFATHSINPDGSWKNLTEQYNSSADISPTAGQMPRLVGLAYASKLYRENKGLHHLKQFSDKGNEVAFGTIGNASCAEGPFFEAMNAAGVLQIPMLMSVWDDGYGISVPNDVQITKSNISEILKGFQRDEDNKGFEIFVVNGWDYPALCETYAKAAKICREEHVPCLVHVVEITQPQGHSTSGSHERYKPAERLEWEKEHDCLLKMREWMISEEIASEEEIANLEQEATKSVKDQKNASWKAFVASMKEDHDMAVSLLGKVVNQTNKGPEVAKIQTELAKTLNPERLDAIRAVKKAIRLLRFEEKSLRIPMQNWLKRVQRENADRYNSWLYNEAEDSALNIPQVSPQYNEDSPTLDGREIVQACFDAALEKYPEVFAIGEDVGKIGDVNQGFAGLQEKYGELRVTDTGIREATIMGQAVGTALRGLRPIAEIQYLDYFLYGIQTLSDDLACLSYRTKGKQKAPVIIRTRGHRLEGVWHSGSPMGMIIHALRGVHVLTPRNMTQAAGFYNTILQSGDPAVIVECLNGYRLKERLPTNIGEFTVPLGVPETIREGKDITIVTYGSMCRIILSAAEQLEKVGISCEVIDVQSLLPFDLEHKIVESIQKTNRVLFADEDMPGATTAYMMQKVVEEQGAYKFLDSKPQCLAAQPHRPAYASDGDYFSKPNEEDIFDKVYAMMSEVNPQKFPALYN